MNAELKQMFDTLKLRHAMNSYEGLASDPALLSKLSLDEALCTIFTEEINSRESNRRKMLMKLAKIPLPSDLKDVSYDEERGQGFVKIMASLKSMEWIMNGMNLCVYGASGTGKSWLASAIANEAVRRGMPVIYGNASDLLADLADRKSQGRRAYASARKSLLGKRLLVIDDFCLRAPDEQEQNVLFDVLNDRLGKRSTLVTSQKDRNLWIEDMGVTPIAEAIAERLCASAWSLTLGGRSRRGGAPG